MTLDDLTGRQFGRLVAQWPAGRGHLRGYGNHIHWLCLCNCGNLRIAIAGDLRSGNAISCGCARIKHGHAIGQYPGQNSPTYRTWLHMLDRCSNSRHSKWKYYGGRGIVVCERWHSFENFLADMGLRSVGLSLDRINNDGNYEPNNCRWSTRSEQMRNSRPRMRRYIGPTMKDRTFFSVDARILKH